MDEDQNKNYQSSSTGNQATNSPDDIEDPEKMLTMFKDRLMEDLNLADSTPEEKKEIEEKIGKLVNDRILNLIMMYLPEDKVAELDKMIGQKSQDEVMQFIMASVPGIQDKIAEELFEIRNDLLNSLRQNNAIGE